MFLLVSARLLCGEETLELLRLQVVKLLITDEQNLRAAATNHLCPSVSLSLFTLMTLLCLLLSPRSSAEFTHTHKNLSNLSSPNLLSGKCPHCLSVGAYATVFKKQWLKS